MRLRAPWGRKTDSGPELGALKLRALDAAARILEPASLADLGGVWAVDGGYSLYALERHRLASVTICDYEFTGPLEARAGDEPRLRLRRGDFTTPEAVEEVGEVDALVMFDILLHQVAPDWQDVLRMYASSTGAFVLAGPWWNRGESVRLLDLGHERYLDLVPIPQFHAPILEHLDEYNPERGRVWRDCPDIWQWGISDADLREIMSSLGFRLAYHENAGIWRGLDAFDDCSYVFVRDSPA